MGFITIDSRAVFLAIEVKTPKRKKQVSEEQKNFLKMVNEGGGIGFVATSPVEALNLLLDAKKVLTK